MRPTLGSVSGKGCFRISRSFDGIGAMAKSPNDLKMVVEAILTPEVKVGIPKGGFASVMKGKKGLEGMRIGFVKSSWGSGDDVWEDTAKGKKWGRGLVVSFSSSFMM